MNVIHVGVGAICQSDLDLAQATGACIVGFNVRTPPPSVCMAAAQANIKVCIFGHSVCRLCILSKGFFRFVVFESDYLILNNQN